MFWLGAGTQKHQVRVRKTRLGFKCTSRHKQGWRLSLGFPWMLKNEWFAETLPANILSWRLGWCSSLKHSVNQRTSRPDSGKSFYFQWAQQSFLRSPWRDSSHLKRCCKDPCKDWTVVYISGLIYEQLPHINNIYPFILIYPYLLSYFIVFKCSLSFYAWSHIHRLNAPWNAWAK